METECESPNFVLICNSAQVTFHVAAAALYALCAMPNLLAQMQLTPQYRRKLRALGLFIPRDNMTR